MLKVSTPENTGLQTYAATGKILLKLDIFVTNICMCVEDASCLIGLLSTI